ncbi:HD-GYP domain-containing protein [Dendrosporobacter sp. 1207_IL3150]|uniref:HD-GYP domain-containing protein n=1 Tax=Dendrosporobacter sp. 1207_IL3150 TaxID=3084054 RepID=UPI002FDAE467
MQFNIHPINLLRALSMALELSTGGLSRHHWRTAMISGRIAEYIGLDEAQQQTIIYAALLHDIGAASSWEEKKKLHIFNTNNQEIFHHAEAGYELLKDSPQLGLLAEPIRHHHDYWDGSNPTRLFGKTIPIASRIINLADRLEVLLRDNVPIFEQRPDILSAIRKLSGIYFDPDLVKALHEFARQESFWLDLVNPHYYNNFFKSISSYGIMKFTVDDVINIAEIFATIIDRTSSFTASHSRSVSIMAAYLAEAKGYSSEEIKAMRIAGLLHDLGKLAVPNEILEKPGKLNEWEFAMVKQHTYYTYRILEQIDGFDIIAEWAAYHHETLDGSGYPFRINEKSLRLGSRIVAVADVFVALTENRPYRATLPLGRVEQIMQGMVSNRKLDGNIVADLFGNCQEAYGLMQASISDEVRKVSGA